MPDVTLLKERIIQLTTQFGVQSINGDVDDAVKTLDAIEDALDRLIAASQKATH
jgi:hypothetical protein